MKLAFCVTGSGRCGTKWLASLLDESDPEVEVHHEPLRRNRPFKQMTKNPHRNYLSLARLFEERMVAAERWGTVSCYARGSVSVLAAAGITMVGLVRDGRACTASLKHIMPHLTYQQACERWTGGYAELLELRAPIYRLEDLNRDFDTFRDLCGYVGCAADRETWERYLGLRFHVRSEKPRKLNARQEAIFLAMCTETQVTFGYSLTGK